MKITFQDITKTLGDVGYMVFKNDKPFGVLRLIRNEPVKWVFVIEHDKEPNNEFPIKGAFLTAKQYVEHVVHVYKDDNESIDK